MQTYKVTVDVYGVTRWYQNGLLHRTDGPAVEQMDGSKYWYQNGLLHRTDGPAVKEANGDKFWYQKGLLHRTDGPAIEWADGTKVWYQNGLRHRLDGPAVATEYWIEGRYFTKNEFLKYTTMKIKSLAKELTMAEIENLLGYPIKVVK